MNFESALNTLESIVNKMEQGGLSLEEALKVFEEGIKLTQSCQKALNDAEQKVSVLIERNGLQKLEPFNDDESE